MVYLDTSVAVPLFVAEPSSDQVDRWFSVCDVPVVSSDWIIAEFASALSIKERSGALAAKDAKVAWRNFETFFQSGLRVMPVSRDAYTAAAKMAREHAHGLRAGDALHLAAALEMGVHTIATLDAVMTANAKRLKMKVVTFS
jgi:predicted nucleic acid-binding protein